MSMPSSIQEMSRFEQHIGQYVTYFTLQRSEIKYWKYNSQFPFMLRVKYKTRIQTTATYKY